MNNTGFFTAVRYSDNLKLSFGESALQTVDNYFYLGGKKAHVITNAEGQREAVLSGTNSSLLARIIKAASYFTVVLPLVLLAAKAVLRYSLRDTYNFTHINVAQRLAEDINQASTGGFDGAQLINEVAQQIQSRTDGDEQVGEVKLWSGESAEQNLHWRARKVGDRVEIFTTRNQAGQRDWRPFSIVFHMNDDDKTLKLYRDLIDLKEVTIANELDKVLVPSANYIFSVGGGTHAYIIQQRHTHPVIDSEEAVRDIENEYRGLSKDKPEQMKKVVCQIATLVARTQFTHDKNSGYPFTNFPLTRVSSGPHLRNLDGVAAVATDLVNGDVDARANRVPFTRGLLALASTREQVNIMDNELEKQGIWLRTKEVKQRWDEVDADVRLERFYAERSILGTSQTDDHWALPVINLEELGLNVNEQGKIKRDGEEHNWEMRNAITFVIRFINFNLNKSDTLQPIKTRRRIDLNLANVNPELYTELSGNQKLRWKEDLECFKTVGAASHGDLHQVDEAARKKLWLPRILQALKDKGHIFNFTVDPACLHYVIQA